MSYYIFRDETSVEPFKEEILKCDVFARLIQHKDYGWLGFKAIDLCYGYKTLYAHLPEETAKAKVIKDLFVKKKFGGWDTELMQAAIAEYKDKQYDVEFESYKINEEQIADTNEYIKTLKLKADVMSINLDAGDGQVTTSDTIMENLKQAYILLDKFYDMRTRLRASLLGKLADKGSKIRGDKETTWLERVNNETRLARKNRKQGSEPVTEMIPEEAASQ